MAKNFEVGYKISGVHQLKQRMQSLPTKLQQRGARAAVKAGAEKIAAAARSLASNIDDPATGESIEANIAVLYSSRASKKDVRLVYRVGVLGGAKEGRNAGGGPGGDTWYWRLLEFGTSKMGARPFMRPAMEQEGAYAAEEVATVMERFLDRAVKD